MEADLTFNSWYQYEQQQTSQNQYMQSNSLALKEQNGLGFG